VPGGYAGFIVETDRLRDGRDSGGIIAGLLRTEKAISGRGPQLADTGIVKMLQAITSSQRTFMRIDAVDEGAAAQRLRLFHSLNKIHEKSPNKRIFLIGRLHIQVEIENSFSGRLVNLSVGRNKGNIVRYLGDRLAEEVTLDATNESLEAEILEKTPENISQM